MMAYRVEIIGLQQPFGTLVTCYTDSRVEDALEHFKAQFPNEKIIKVFVKHEYFDDFVEYEVPAEKHGEWCSVYRSEPGWVQLDYEPDFLFTAEEYLDTFNEDTAFHFVMVKWEGEDAFVPHVFDGRMVHETESEEV
jgi:hypothetical protein